MAKKENKTIPQITFGTDEKWKFLSLLYFLLHLLPAEESNNANNKYANYYLDHSIKSLSNVE